MVEMIGFYKKSLENLVVSKKNIFVPTALKEGEKISIVYDDMFRIMLYNDKRIKYSAKLISYFIDVAYEDILKSMRLVKGTLDKNYPQDKGKNCDYVSEIGDTILNIEMNNNQDKAKLLRNLDYLNNLYSSKNEAGKEYKFCQTIQFNINNFSFKEVNKVFDYYALQNDEGFALTNKIIVVQIYLPKLLEKWYNVGTEGLEEREKFILGLILQDSSKAEEVGGEIKVMKDFISDAVKTSKNKELYPAYDNYLAREKLHKKEMDESREEGLQEGRTEAQEKIARNFLEKEIDINIISECTGLSVEKIKSLKNKL